MPKDSHFHHLTIFFSKGNLHILFTHRYNILSLFEYCCQLIIQPWIWPTSTTQYMNLYRQKKVFALNSYMFHIYFLCSKMKDSRALDLYFVLIF